MAEKTYETLETVVVSTGARVDGKKVTFKTSVPKGHVVAMDEKEARHLVDAGFLVVKKEPEKPKAEKK